MSGIPAEQASERRERDKPDASTGSDPRQSPPGNEQQQPKDVTDPFGADEPE